MLRFRVEVEERSGDTYLESAFTDRDKAIARAARLARPFRSVKVTDWAENRLVQAFEALWERRLPPTATPALSPGEDFQPQTRTAARGRRLRGAPMTGAGPVRKTSN